MGERREATAPACDGCGRAVLIANGAEMCCVTSCARYGVAVDVARLAADRRQHEQDARKVAS